MRRLLGPADYRPGDVRNVNEDTVTRLISDIKEKATATGIPDAVAQCDAGSFAGKVVIDAMHPLEMSPAFLEKGLLIGHTTSAGEQVAQSLPGANIVKAFNTIGAQNMANPKFSGQSATIFICGDDKDAKRTVKQLSDELGFETVDAGPLKIARLLEPMAMLWMHLAYDAKIGPNFGFKLIRQ
jgi:predicted dinucleotide-binding enzyme